MAQGRPQLRKAGKSAPSSWATELMPLSCQETDQQDPRPVPVCPNPAAAIQPRSMCPVATEWIPRIRSHTFALPFRQHLTSPSPAPSGWGEDEGDGRKEKNSGFSSADAMPGFLWAISPGPPHSSPVGWVLSSFPLTDGETEAQGCSGADPGPRAVGLCSGSSLPFSPMQTQLPRRTGLGGSPNHPLRPDPMSARQGSACAHVNLSSPGG